MKLGPSTLAKIGKIKIHRNTILLLDALDEDPTSFGRVEERIIELLDATADFHKVIITCRTQFFSGYRSDPFERPGQVVIGGYTCPTKYLANFDERKVDKYLTKRFGKYSWSGRKAIKRARAMVSGMGSLRCRPMLLAHIDILLNSPGLAVRPTEFEIYESLLKAWLNRQELKSKVPATELWRVCAILANRMLKAGNQRRISQAWLDAFKEGANIMRSLGAMDLEGRSLLNRTSDGDFRFSHETIQEFLCAHGALSADESVPLERFVATPFVAKLIWEKILSDRPFEPTRIDLVDFSGASLNQVDLRERDLTGIRLPRLRFENSDFTGANLTGANLAGCSFINCNFTSATLDGIVVDGTDISGADFTEASLRGVRGSRTNFSGCNFYMSIVSESELKDCKFTGSTSLGWANFSRCSLVRCDFDETDWSGPNYRSEPDWSAFKGGDLWRQVGQGARAGIETPWSLEECTFQRVINMCPEFAKRLPLG